MKGGFTAVYAHLVPGSVSVEVGERVRAGHHLGLLGNSGASLAPHLHFHIVDGPNVSASDGYPFVFDSFKLAAQSDISALAAALQGEAAFPPRDQMAPVRHRRRAAARLHDQRLPGPALTELGGTVTARRRGCLDAADRTREPYARR